MSWRRLSVVVALPLVAALVWLVLGREDDVPPSRDLAVYLGSGDVWAIEGYERWLGRTVDRFVDFIPGETWEEIENPAWLVDRWVSADRPVVYSVPMLPSGEDADLERGARGEYNHYFRRLAELLVDRGQNDAVLRLGWEFNGNWYSWAAHKCPACFVEYWRQIVATMRSVGESRFLFDWNPTLGRQEITPDRVYPGDKYVDLIGLDVYADLDARRGASPRERWRMLLTRPYGLEWHKDFAARHGKPMTFPEWGLNARSEEHRTIADDPYFIGAMADWIEANRVEYHGYFEFNAPDGAHALANGQFPRAAERFRERFS